MKGTRVKIRVTRDVQKIFEEYRPKVGEMASERDIIIAMQEAVRTALCEAANEEIKKLIHKFECDMGAIKRDMVCKIVNQIQISSSHDLPRGEYVIQIRLNGGREDGK